MNGYVRSDGLDVYYDIQGSGPPLLMLHGGMATLALFDGLRQLLNAHWTTVGIEQQGHGHTADREAPLRFRQMADDTAAVIRHLDLSRPHVFGHSDGANVALGLAILHPGLVGRIVACGVNVNKDGLLPDMRRSLEEGAKQEPAKLAAQMPAMLREAYEAVAPDPAGWPTLVHRVHEQAATFEGWSEAQLQAIRSPVMAMAGDQDVVKTSHQEWLARTCGQGYLCILPRTDHLAPVSRAGWVAQILQDFLTEDLDAPMPMQAAHD